ncbi:MAG: SH3 domain-containing protein [Chloroflexota bacterium]
MHSIFHQLAGNERKPAMKRLTILLTSIVLVTMLSGCNAVRQLVLGTGPEPTETATQRALMPTFTATIPAPAVVATDTPVVVEPTATETPIPPTEPPQPAATDTPPPSPKLAVIGPANIRNGPGTTYGIVGAANPGEQFDLNAKSPDSAWWQICCINGQQGWIFGQLAQVENAADIQVAQNIPPAPAPPTATPVPPTPVPAAPTPVPQAAAPDPCAGIGGDGCKWKVREGPKFGGNGGGEIKLQLFFVHGGRGDEPQGSYFVVMEKNGGRLPIGDGTRSIAKDRRSGPLGPYNYEYKINLNQIPDGNVAGGYTMWVLDGNGERDSRNTTFSIPDGQGEVWMIWDQN